MRILRGLAGKRLECGCLTGVYETYSGEVVEVLDGRAGTCPHRDHVEGTAISGPAPMAPEAKSAPQPPQFR